MGHTVWDLIYDFLDEVMASIMPGAYFLSYFVLWSVFFFSNSLFQFLSDGAVPVFTVFVIVLCYCIGTVFRRSDMKKVDKISAYHIYKHQDRDAGSYAFADTLTASMDRLKTSYGNLALAPPLSGILKEMNKDGRQGILFRFFRAVTHPWTSAYGKLCRYYKKVNKRYGKEKGYEAFLAELKKILYPQIDYPYVKLPDYLRSRKLSIKSYADWDEKSRSKMKINNYKVEIAAKAPHLLPLISKNEAHIRFMNSMWYASSALLFCASFFCVISAGLLFAMEYADWAFIHVLFRMDHLIIIIVLSMIYVSAALFVKNRVRSIIHYQRVRELVFLLTTYKQALEFHHKETHALILKQDENRITSSPTAGRRAG